MTCRDVTIDFFLMSCEDVVRFPLTLKDETFFLEYKKFVGEIKDSNATKLNVNLYRTFWGR